jgi:hypothetical protein
MKEATRSWLSPAGEFGVRKWSIRGIRRFREGADESSEILDLEVEPS